MQGYATVFRTEDKIAYLRRLMAVGFDCLDLASFVSPKSIPQMVDSVQVLDALAPDKGLNKFLVIAANGQGIDAALAHEAVDAVGVPFSISEQFQIRNTKRSQEQALDDWSASVDRLHSGDKQLVVYLSMAFGNPYDEAHSIDLVAEWTARVVKRFNPHVLSISDTVGNANPEGIRSVVSAVRKEAGTAENRP